MKPYLLAALAFLSAGCAARYAITTNGFLDASLAGGLPAGSSFAVVGNADAANPIFDREVGAKIERMLELRGYRLAPLAEAAYALRYGYDVSGRIDTVTRPEFVHGPPVIQNVYVSGQRYTAVSSFDYVTHVRESEAVYTARLFLRVLDAGPFRAAKEEKPVWIGDTIGESDNRDLRETVDYLLAATFRHFGRNTGRNLREKVTPADPDVRALRGETAPPAPRTL